LETTFLTNFKIMNRRQIEKNGMYQKLSVFFANTQNSAVWKSFTRLVNEILKFTNLIETLSTYMVQQGTGTNGLTKTKDSAFVTMVKVTVKKAQKAYVWAQDNNNAPLMETFDVAKTDFFNGSETDALVNVKNIRDAVNANITAMKNIQLSSDDVAAVDAAITTYESTLGKSGAAQSHKMGGTEGIDNVVRQIDQSLDIIDKLLDSTYSESNPDMVQEYWNNRSIDKLPTRHSGLSVHITNAKTGSDIEGAILQLNGKSDTSDINGIAEIIKIKSGTYNATITYNEITETINKVVIERGKITEVEVKIG
jgi:hypothetical protein